MTYSVLNLPGCPGAFFGAPIITWIFRPVATKRKHNTNCCCAQDPSRMASRGKFRKYQPFAPFPVCCAGTLPLPSRSLFYALPFLCLPSFLKIPCSSLAPKVFSPPQPMPPQQWGGGGGEDVKTRATTPTPQCLQKICTQKMLKREGSHSVKSPPQKKTVGQRQQAEVLGTASSRSLSLIWRFLMGLV